MNAVGADYDCDIGPAIDIELHCRGHCASQTTCHGDELLVLEVSFSKLDGPDSGAVKAVGPFGWIDPAKRFTITHSNQVRWMHGSRLRRKFRVQEAENTLGRFYSSLGEQVDNIVSTPENMDKPKAGCGAANQRRKNCRLKPDDGNLSHDLFPGGCPR